MRYIIEEATKAMNMGKLAFEERSKAPLLPLKI